ncbi:hypothetical protein FRC08_017260 [Ceratobasidium sp. 394]|nr:hypothetical protein FRC08_017260 [Ceratobasidium sp. 394]
MTQPPLSVSSSLVDSGYWTFFLVWNVASDRGYPSKSQARAWTYCNGLVVEAPSYIIEDHICGGKALANKEFHGIPVVSWWVASAVSYLSHFGGDGYGDGGRLLDAMIANLEKQELGSERSIEEILAQVRALPQFSLTKPSHGGGREQADASAIPPFPAPSRHLQF